MARRLDRVLVVDVESTCWEGNLPPGQMSEIIEVGLCVVEVAALERVERRSILVRPACSTVSAYCTQLTTLTQTDVDAGILLAEACRVLADECKSGVPLEGTHHRGGDDAWNIAGLLCHLLRSIRGR